LVKYNGDHSVRQAVFDSMFDPVIKGGLGMNERSFFETTYHVDRPYSPPRWVSAKHWARYTACGRLNKG
jgi:hypothetical protein